MDAPAGRGGDRGATTRERAAGRAAGTAGAAGPRGGASAAPSVKITGIRSMRLWGPLLHGQGGETGGEIGKVIVQVDTDAGIHGLGEADDFMGVRQGIE